MKYDDYTLTKEHSSYRLYLKWHLVLNITDGSQRSYWYKTKKEAMNIINHNFVDGKK